MGDLPREDFYTHWTQVNEGLPDNPWVTCLTVTPEENIFLGAYDQGLFTNMYPVWIPQPKKRNDDYSVVNHPNPFTGSTTFTFTVPQTGHAALKLYTSMGHELMTITEGIYQKGSYRFRWEPSGIAPGIYIYTLEMNGITLHGKLLLLP